MLNCPVIQSLPCGYIVGAGLAYSGSSTVQILPGRARGFLNCLDLSWDEALSADIETTGANGLDAGEEAPDKWYAVHIICGSELPIASLFSLSPTEPTLPEGYKDFRRIGWVRNNSNSDFIEFVQIGSSSDREIWYASSATHTRVLDNGNAVTFTDVDCSAFVPSTSRKIRFSAFFEMGSLGSPSDFFAVKPKGSSQDGVWQWRLSYPATGKKSRMEIERPCSENQKVEYKVQQAGVNLNELTLSVAGYTDSL